MKKEYEDILNDGWADDVMPDPVPLPRTASDASEGASQGPDTTEPGKSPSGTDAFDVLPKRKSGFRLFLLVWILLLTVAALYGLSLLKRYTINYQAALEESDPDRAASELLTYFRTKDATAILNMTTSLPESDEFSSEDRSLETIYTLLAGRQITYTHADDATADEPIYWIYADDVIIARAVYRKKPQATDAYGFPLWYLSELELYLPDFP